MTNAHPKQKLKVGQMYGSNYNRHVLFFNQGARDADSRKSLCTEKVFPIEPRAIGPPDSNSKLLCTENLKTTKVEN